MGVGPEGTVAIAYYTTKTTAGAVATPSAFTSSTTEWIVEFAVSDDPFTTNPNWHYSQVSSRVVHVGSVPFIADPDNCASDPAGPRSGPLAHDFEMARTRPASSSSRTPRGASSPRRT